MKTARKRLAAVIVGVLLGGWAVADDKKKTATPLGPCAVVAAKDGKTLFVANMDARQVAVVDVVGCVKRTTSARSLDDASTTVRFTHPTIDMPAPPTGMVLSPDGGKLYVTCAAPKSTVAVIDTARLKQLAAIPAGHTATGLAVTPDGRRLFVCNRFDNDVSVIDPETGRQIARVAATREPIAAVATPDGKYVLVANHLPLDPFDSQTIGAVVTLIDTGSLKPTSIRLPDGATGLRDMCISPDGKYAFVTHILANFQMATMQVEIGWINTNAVSMIDLAKKECANHALLDDYELGAANPWGVRFSGDGKSLLVTHAGTHELSVIDYAPVLERMNEYPEIRGPMSDSGLVHDHRRRILLPGKGPRGMAVVGSKVFVAEYFSDTIAVVDIAARQVRGEDTAALRTIPLGPEPKPSIARRGEMLFHDATICRQHWQSCASCHPGGRTDGLNWDLMNDGTGNFHNAKSLVFSHLTPPAMVSGIRKSAEEAVRAGIKHILFSERPESEAAAIDEYLKSLRPVRSPRLVDGRFSEAARRGYRLFKDKRVGCSICHRGPLFTDKRMHNVASSNPYDRRKYDTPTLIEIWRTAPYMHDGSFTTVKNLLTRGRHGSTRGGVGHLNEQQIDDLVEFVLSL